MDVRKVEKIKEAWGGWADGAACPAAALRVEDGRGVGAGHHRGGTVDG